jgi:hypothetical protein
MKYRKMTMDKIKSHTFNGRKYKIELVDSIDGVTDIPGEPEEYEMLILKGNGVKALHSALHEGLEGCGCCECIHRYEERKDGRPSTWDVARFLWRLGYRIT